MKNDCYDFDKTIYDGDSSIDFYLFCLKKNIRGITILPKLILFYMLYFFHIVDKLKVKECFFAFVKKYDDIPNLVKDFWQLNSAKIKKFYIEKKDHTGDIIISASPEFLLKPICDKYNVKDLISSIVDDKTGHFLSPNCKGEEKVNRLFKKYKNIQIKNFYTDSFSDKPLIDLSMNAYLIKKNKITKIK